MFRAVLLMTCALLTATASALSADDPRRSAIADLLDADQFEPAAVLLDDYLADHPKDALMHYNAACADAQLLNIDAAEQHLRMAVKHGFLRFSVIQRDPDLKSLRSGEIFNSLVAARDAADGILAGRRNEQWLQRLKNGQYQLLRDRDRKIDLISALEPAAAQAAMIRIAELADTYVGFFDRTLRNSITIVLLTDVDAQVLFSNDRVRGNYRHAMRELIVSNPGRSLQHELAHAFHHNHMDAVGQEHPIWVQEGLASLFEAFDVDERGQVTFLPNDRQTMMKYLIAGDAFPARWAELLQCSTATFKRDAHQYYPFARSVFEYVAAHANMQDWYKQYVSLFDVDATGKAALVAELAAPLHESEAGWRLWVMSRDAAPAKEEYDKPATRLVTRSNAPIEVNAETFTDVDSSDSRTIIIERDMTVAAALYAELRPSILAGEYENAVDRLRAVIALDPDHADARYDLALACIQTGDNEGACEQYEHLRRLNMNLARMVRACLKPAS